LRLACTGKHLQYYYSAKHKNRILYLANLWPRTDKKEERIMRPDGRKPNQLRPITFTKDFIAHPYGSVLISQGNTRVLCNVSVEDKVPKWMQSQNIPGGWVTAEYAMLPASTHTRRPRETHGFSGRTQEIRRLIGRSMRMALDLKQLGPRTLTVDCDVLQADGGTRTASITGAYVALAIAIQKLESQGQLDTSNPLNPIAAVSVGIVDGIPILDLSYEEDSKAEVDMNVVMTGEGDFIEVQGTAEHSPFTGTQLSQLLDYAHQGIRELIILQENTLNNNPS
jgi:ribonuclease PH